MTAARRTRTRARCNMVLVVFLNCNTRSFNNQVNKIFVEHFTWFSSYLYFFTFYFFAKSHNYTESTNQAISSWSSLQTNFSVLFIFAIFDLYFIGLDLDSSRQSTYFLWFAKIFRPNSLHHYHHHQLKHSTRKGRSGQAARRSQLLHTAWAKPVLVFGALETFCIDSLSICRRSNRKHAELRAKTLAHLTHLQRNFVPQN